MFMTKGEFGEFVLMLLKKSLSYDVNECIKEKNNYYEKQINKCEQEIKNYDSSSKEYKECVEKINSYNAEIENGNNLMVENALNRQKFIRNSFKNIGVFVKDNGKPVIILGIIVLLTSHIFPNIKLLKPLK